MLLDLSRDCRYACRTLLRTPAFTGAVILTLGLGIGATVVIFSAVDAVLLRAAPVADPGRVVDVYTSSGSSRSPIRRIPTTSTSATAGRSSRSPHTP